ncbi:MAG TPA: pantetheine-phosphate adenylyltransferase [Clostridiales bacterium]|jgi:pantetheine-phosphate adenylyltransferase|nr:pantetheine-phosphate adenylyltransferase [Clostridiales bacterium]
MRRVLYAGSFDPITNGHLDLIERSSKLCGQLLIGVIQNVSKNSFFTMEERSQIIIDSIPHLKNVEVITFDGLLADFVNKNNIDAVVRGLRATTDFELEIQMAQMNARLYRNAVETIFLMTAPQYSFVSSSIVKEVFALNGDVEGLIPQPALDALRRKNTVNT